MEHESAKCYESKVQTCKGINRLHIGNRYTYFMRKFPVFEIFEVKRLWPISRTVKGQPRSKVMVPIDGVWCMGGFLFNFHWAHHRVCRLFRNNRWQKILMTLNYEGSRSYGVKVHSIIERPRLVSYLTSFVSNIRTQFSRYLKWKSSDLDLRRFKVNQG